MEMQEENCTPPPPPPPCQTWKAKKQGTLSACLGLPIGYMKFLFPKEFITIFGLGYYPLQRAPYLLNIGLLSKCYWRMKQIWFQAWNWFDTSVDIQVQ